MNIKQVATVSTSFDTSKAAMAWAQKQTQFAKFGARLYIMKLNGLYFVVRTITKRDHTELRMVEKRTHRIMTYIEYVSQLVGKPIPWLYTVTDEPLYLVK